MFAALTEITIFQETYHPRDKSSISRHSIMHGDNISYGNEINSFKVLSLLFYLSDIVSVDTTKKIDFKNMLPPNQTTCLSKLLSHILRHKSEEYKIVLDENGYINVDKLINKLNAHHKNMSFEILQYIVDSNKKSVSYFNNT